MKEPKERMQVNFLKYLLMHASSLYQIDRSGLYRSARLFLKMMFREMGSELPDFKTVDVHLSKGDNHLFITLDQKQTIIFQSNVTAWPSNEALTEQVVQLMNTENVKPENIYPIILKTQYEFTVDEAQYIYPLITRKDMLWVFFGEQTKGIKDKKFNDYRKWLIEINEEFSGYRNRPPSEWGYKEWIGYSNHMEEEMNWGNWIFRPNGADGSFEFLG